jgi:hypothetical protein
LQGVPACSHWLSTISRVPATNSLVPQITLALSILHEFKGRKVLIPDCAALYPGNRPEEDTCDE